MEAFNFLSYIQSRYPCSTKNVQGLQIPKYDGFCLDINSILFANIYSNKSLPNEEIFGNNMDHIDFLFRSVKPTKFLFIAFDGVLPNAKINYLKNKLIAIKDSISNVNKDNSFLKTSRNFDISYFTAGTPFITELYSYLKHFLAYKISTDSKWQKIKIFINGPEIPGESKVKIAQFIRYYKAHNDRQIAKYCLYTFDPELLILGLSTHEPYISIIQDRISYLKIKNSITPEQTDFSITHLSLIRKYLKDEYALLFQGKLKFEFDFEKMLDDWILIGILISTHSLPCFSHLSAENGALPSVFKAYLKVLRELDGYINEYGELRVSRLQIFLNRLSNIEMKIFESEDCEILKQENIKHKLKSIDIDKAMAKSDKRKEKQQLELPTIPTEIRNDYYKKFELQSSSDVVLEPTMVSEYIKSIQWHLKYYYQECCSWTWSYSYPQAPLISDMHNLNDVDFNFETEKSLDTPDSLMSVSSSSNPQDVLPDKKEVSNTKTKIYLFVYSESKVDSLAEEYGFSSFVNHADLKFIKIEDLNVPKEVVLEKSTNKCITFDDDMTGFPSFNHISYKLRFELKKKSGCGDSSSENEIVILDLPSHISNNFQAAAARVLGKSFFVNWPYVEEAYVYSITNFKTEISLKMLFTNCDESNMMQKNLSYNEIKTLKEETKNLKKIYDSIGVNIGITTLLLRVYLKIGDCHKYESRDKLRLQSIYDFQTTFVPYQLLAQRTRIMPELRYKFIHNVFGISNLCFMIGHPHYGSLGEIKSVTSKNTRFSVKLNVMNESKDYFKALFKTNNLYNFELLKYLDTISVAKILGLKPFVLHTICQSIYVVEKTIQNGTVKEKKHDIGIRLKYPTNSQEQTLGYTIKRDSFWFFSKLAIELIRNYMLEFPEIIEMVDKKANTKEYDASECLKNAAITLKSVNKWLQESRKIVAEVQKDIQKFVLNNVNALDQIVSKKKSPVVEIDVDVSPEVLFKAGTTSGLVAPDKTARHDLLDRIICIRENFTVPFGLKGTIINIITTDNSSKLYNIYEVLFDSPFPGGLTLYGSAKCKCYRLTVADFINISYGKRNKENDTNDQNKEKVKMKKSIKMINKNVQKKEDKRFTQSKEKEKLPKFARKSCSFDFSVN